MVLSWWLLFHSSVIRIKSTKKVIHSYRMFSFMNFGCVTVTMDVLKMESCHSPSAFWLRCCFFRYWSFSGLRLNLLFGLVWQFFVPILSDKNKYLIFFFAILCIQSNKYNVIYFFLVQHDFFFLIFLISVCIKYICYIII